MPRPALSELRKLAEERPLGRRQLSSELGIHFEKSLRVGEILKSLRSPPRRVAASTQLFVEEIDGANHAQRHVFECDLIGTGDGDGQHGIVAELDWCPVR